MTPPRTSLAACLVGILLAGCGSEENKVGKRKEIDPVHSLDLADVHLKHGKLAEARKAYKAAGKESEKPEILFRMEFGLGLVDEAEEKFDDALPPLSPLG